MEASGAEGPGQWLQRRSSSRLVSGPKTDNTSRGRPLQIQAKNRDQRPQIPTLRQRLQPKAAQMEALEPETGTAGHMQSESPQKSRAERILGQRRLRSGGELKPSRASTSVAAQWRWRRRWRRSGSGGDGGEFPFDDNAEHSEAKVAREAVRGSQEAPIDLSLDDLKDKLCRTL